MDTRFPEPDGVGRTKDAGWQIGVSETVPYPIERVWDFLTSERGAALWLGRGVSTSLDEVGGSYETTEGGDCQTRSFHPLDRIRLTWRPPDADHDTTVQVAVTSSGPDKTKIQFHQERMLDGHEREQQREHWRSVMAAIVAALETAQS